MFQTREYDRAHTVDELRTLRRAVKRLGLKVECWEDDEYIAVSELGHIGGTLAKDERDAIERANETP